MSLPTQIQSQLEDCYEDFILQGYTDEEAAEMQNSFMEQRPPIISDAELTALEQGSDINTYSISEPEEDVKPFDPVQNRRQIRRQRRLKAATR